MTTTIKNVTVFSLWTLFCFIIAWAHFSKGCNHEVQPAADTKYIDTMNKLREVVKKRGDSITYYIQKDQYNNSVIDDVVSMYQDADSVARLRSSVLKETQKQLAIARGANDTATQLRECDSLDAQLTMWRSKYDDANNLCNLYVFQSSRELYQKDSTIELQQRQIVDLLSLNALADTVYKRAGSKIVPVPVLRGYLGATGSVGAYNSIGVHLDLLNRKDFMYKGAIRFGSGGPSYEIGASKLLSFKKH